MGVLTDLILATEAELMSVPRDEAPMQVLPVLDIKGIDIIKLASLRDLLTGAEFDPDLKAFPEIGTSGSEDGPWIHRCPDDLLHFLADLDDPGVARVGDSWASTEEFRLDGWEAQLVVACLQRLRDFARRALAAGKPVHLWTSL